MILKITQMHKHMQRDTGYKEHTTRANVASGTFPKPVVYIHFVEKKSLGIVVFFFIFPFHDASPLAQEFPYPPPHTPSSPLFSLYYNSVVIQEQSKAQHSAF